MTTFTAQQVEKAFEDQFDSDWSELRYGVEHNNLEIQGGYVDLEFVEGEGGMDEGSNARVVFKIGDQYFLKEGFYQSHYGFEWDSPLYEAAPVQKTVTHYEKV